MCMCVWYYVILFSMYFIFWLIKVKCVFFVFARFARYSSIRMGLFLFIVFLLCGVFIVSELVLVVSVFLVRMYVVGIVCVLLFEYVCVKMDGMNILIW